ncbi:Clp amino terminal domain containing protein, putative [Babesia bigemina]|uniref:Clp amino terminal domain containing protein, putative n=1 Tax=Babesia bigemina TaxID=5866 RepID=A0A061DBN2_BABBI|nr:Clp amino terminal domain containing protein, putative [Babesia bigemina]CDR97352.1 Clp amino terminal domain containing protein, putative [Babesia bigemina]|eukprot:XP_012769538.1 Clp amino terminal domain containing protein, putative [Babesia bigemina]
MKHRGQHITAEAFRNDATSSSCRRFGSLLPSSNIRRRCYSTGDSSGQARSPDKRALLNFNNFSDNAVKVLMLSQEEARRASTTQIAARHIFQGLVCLDSGLAAHVLREFGVTVNTIRAAADNIFRVDTSNSNEALDTKLMTFSDEAKEALELSSVEAELLGHSAIETEHILLGLLRCRSEEVARLLNTLSLNPDEVRKLTLKYITEHKEKPEEVQQSDTWKQALSQYSYMPAQGRSVDVMKETYTSPLATFTVDITAKAELGKLPKVLCRDAEIDRAIRTLCRKHKRNPILIGEPGVGKTAVIEGLAMQLLKGGATPSLRHKRLRQLDLGLLVAGARFRGQFEERLTKLIEEVKTMKDVILVIDEAHMLVGAGAGEGALDAANLFKPSLARGEIQCVAITTPKEYRKYFEKDAALSRRFQPIYVNEPTDEDTKTILNATTEEYGKYHKVSYNPEAVAAALKFSKQFIQDRFLPDKAIDILDEAGALAKIRFHARTKSHQEDAGNSATTQDANNERSQTETAANTTQSDSQCSIDAGGMRGAESNGSTTQETNALSGISYGFAVKGDVDLQQTGSAGNEGGMCATISDSDGASGSSSSADSYYTEDSELESDMAEQSPAAPVCEVNTEHVAEVVSTWTGIPLQRLSEDEIEGLRNMESELHKRIIGHEEAVKHICKAIRRAKTNIKNPERPIGSFLFCGPPGVGKSEIAKALTNLLFASEKNIIKLDMSEYNEPHSISRILGSPPGYKGHDSGGQLTEKLRKNPYSVVMFDEIEKAHPNVINILLQVLEDGKLTDSKNQTVSFKNAVIIMTSNTGSNVIERASRGSHTFGFNIQDKPADESKNYSEIKSLVCEELKSQFKPELVDRIDDIIIFRPLTDQQLRQISKLMIEETLKRARDAGMDIVVDDSFVDFVLKLPRDEKGGARPIRRLITSNLEDKLAEFVINKDYEPGKRYRVAVDDQKHIVIRADNDTGKVYQKEPPQPVSPIVITEDNVENPLCVLHTLNEVEV